MNNPNEEHLEVVYRILWYLKITPGKGLYFRKGINKGIEVYFDVDWQDSFKTEGLLLATAPMFEGIM